MTSNHIVEVRIEHMGMNRRYTVVERRSGEPKYYNTTISSSKRLDRVMNTEIKKFTYSLESYMTWFNGNTTLRFMRNTLPSELLIDKELWLHILYPALFEWSPDELRVMDESGSAHSTDQA